MKRNDLPIDVKTYTVDELMDIFNKSRAAIYNWMKSGILPYRQYPGERRFTVEDLKSLNEKLLVNGSNSPRSKSTALQPTA